MKRTLVILLLFVVILTGCRATQPSAPSSPLDPAHEEVALPTLQVAALRSRIPLGSAFPIAVTVTNAPPNQRISLQLTGGGIDPDSTSAHISTNASGRGRTTLNARSRKPQLNVLKVSADIYGKSVADVLYVNFEPSRRGKFAAQSTEEIVGEPTTMEDYYNSLPVVTSLEELKAYEADPPPALVLDDVRLPDEDGNLGEPIDAVQFYTGSGPLHVEAPDAFDDPALSTQACTPKWTHVNLRLEIDTKSRPVPPNTRVFISGDAPDQTRYVKDDGRLDFEFGCGRRIHFRVYAFTSTGMYIHTHTPGSLASWLKTILPGYGAPDFTADSIRNATVMTTEASDATVSRWIQRIWFRINQVYNWERSAHSVYSTFPLSTFYPSNDYFNNVRSRAAVGQIQLVDSDADSDITIVHEFGHEVYYRRLLGASEYNRLHQKAMEGQAAFPICAGATYWQIWKFTDGCAGMLEGFALWFDAVATRVLAVGSRCVSTKWYYCFNPDIRPTDGVIDPPDKSWGKGASTPGRVAQYLWDVTDVHGDNSGMTIRDEDADAVRDTFPHDLDPSRAEDLKKDLNRRYAKVASFFYDAAPNQDFNYMWRYRIRAKLTDTQEANHCKVLVYNTLGGIYGCP